MLEARERLVAVCIDMYTSASTAVIETSQRVELLSTDVVPLWSNAYVHSR